MKDEKDIFTTPTYCTLVLSWFMTFSVTTVLFFTEVSLLQGLINIELSMFHLISAIFCGLISGWYSSCVYEGKAFSLFQSFCGIFFSILICGLTNYFLILYVGWFR